MPSERAPLAERFWAKVDRREPDECWEWRGTRLANGYGVITGMKNGRQWAAKAHRLSLEFHQGRPLVSGGLVLHSCHNRACVNPAHLRIGTHQENMDDMVQAGRSPRPLGSSHGMARLTEEDVIACRYAVNFAGARYGELAEAYGVSRSTIAMAVRGDNWSHI